MRDIRRVVLSTFFCGLVAVPAQAAPLLLTFEGTIPTLSKRITIFTATQAGTVDTTTTDVFLNVPVSGSFTFDSDVWSLAGGPLSSTFPLRQFAITDPANAPGVEGVETPELIAGTLEVDGVGTLSFDRSLISTRPAGAIVTFPYVGSTSMSYLDGTEGLNVGPFEFGDLFALAFSNGFAWIDLTAFPGAPGDVFLRSQSSQFFLSLSSAYNIAFQLQDLFPAGPPLAFSFEDPVPGDCDPFVDCNDGRASLGSFSTFTGVGTLTADGSIGVDTVLNAPSIVVHRAQLRSVPEPSSMALLTIGAAMAARRRYRNGTGSAASPRIAVRRPPRSVLRTHPIV